MTAKNVKSVSYYLPYLIIFDKLLYRKVSVGSMEHVLLATAVIWIWS